MESDPIPPALRQLLARIDQTDDIGTEVETVREQGFTGAEVITIGIAFAVSGLAAGFFKKLGEEMAKDLWSKLKALRSNLDDAGKGDESRQYELEVRVVHQLPEHSQSLICGMSSEDEVHKLDLFKDKLIDAEGSMVGTLVTEPELEIGADGNWKTLR